MSKVILRKSNIERRKLRVRKKVFGTAKKPRLSVYRSLKYTYAQLIDDDAGRTLLSTFNEVKKIHKGKKKTEAAFESGKLLAKMALGKGIKDVVFDRNGYRFHGRVKNLADGAREGGLKL